MQPLVFDSTALVALGLGTRQLSGYVVAARDQPDVVRLYAPALCLAAAEAVKAGLTYHVAGLPFEVIDLSFEDARQVGAAVANGVDWRLAHAAVSARPGLDWPRGRIVVTGEPDAYRTWGLLTVGWSKEQG